MINVKHINGDNMFNGFRILNSNYIYLFLNNNYEFADSDLIDYYIYEIKANQAKLNYLIKMAKIKGLSVHFIKELEYRLSTDEENAI